MDEIVVEYYCPECDTQLSYGSRLCPGCGAIVEWLEAREAAGGAPAEAQVTGAPAVEIEGVVTAPAQEGPAGGPATHEAEGPAVTAGPVATSAARPDAQPARAAVEALAEVAADVPAAATQAGPQALPGAARAPDVPEPPDAPGAAPAGGDGAAAGEVGRTPPADVAQARRGLYMGVFSRRGAVSYSVMALSALGTVLVLNWDTLFGGAGAETVGRMQLAAASIGIATLVVAGSVSVWDAFRAARAAG